MAAGCRELECPPRPLLAANVREIRMLLGSRERSGSGAVRPDGRRVALAAQVRHGLGEVAHRDGANPCERHLGRGLGSTQQEIQAGATRPLGDRERPRDRADTAVERQLADRRVPVEVPRRDLARGCEHGEGDREVEPRALLLQRRRREVDEHATARPLALR